jgi:dipeptidyl-peptidase III
MLQYKMSAPPNASPSQLVVAQMKVGTAFSALSEPQKLYAHHMARAAWFGARIILKQVSPEASAIFDFIVEIHKTCTGHWWALADRLGINHDQVTAFIDYAATFLSNIGNYYGRGDQKFVPQISQETFDKLATTSPKAGRLKEDIGAALLAKSPFSLGYPSESAQSQYYPDGSRRMTEKQISAVSKLMERQELWPENTRLQHTEDDSQGDIINILQASVQMDNVPKVIANGFEMEHGTRYQIRLKRGDFAGILCKICEELRQTLKYAKDEKQRDIIRYYIQSFETGDLEAYRESQRLWVTDMTPRVENIFGFVEPYRDPAGIRSEFEALVAIENPEESGILQRLVDCSNTFIKRLPWARCHTDNNGKGPFEKSLFEPPSFASIHTLAYCSTILFDGINLPNYNDIRESHGFKNVVIANRLAAGSNSDALSIFVHEDVQNDLSKHSTDIGYLWLIIHELLGHGTGKMMTEEREGEFNFDSESPPLNPLTGKPIVSWYRPGQTWTGKFGNIATSVDECRCELVGAFLIGDHDLLRLFGYDERSDLKPADLQYLFYVRLCALALLDLKNYIPESKRWGQAHSRAHFAMLRCLLRDGRGCVRILHEPEQACLKVKVDRELLMTHGRRALEDMLLHLHMYRVTADIGACRPYFEALSNVEDEHLAWRATVAKQQVPRMIYVHANTFLEGGKVSLKEYEANQIGIIQSWTDRIV